MSHGGQDAFDAILQRLPLSPQDFHVIGLASELAGWNESFLERPSAKSGRAKAKAKANGHWIGIDVSCCKAQSSTSTSTTTSTTFWCCVSCAASSTCGGEGPPPTASSSGTWSYACSCPIGSHWRLVICQRQQLHHLQSQWQRQWCQHHHHQHPSCGWMSFWLLPEKGPSQISVRWMAQGIMRSFAQFANIRLILQIGVRTCPCHVVMCTMNVVTVR